MRRETLLYRAMLLAAAFVAPAFSRTGAEELPTASPAEVGMSAEKLAEVDQQMRSLVEKKRLAGGIIAVARNGKVVHLKSFGMMDIEAEKPMSQRHNYAFLLNDERADCGRQPDACR